jgi:tyrosyl-tRNA synthetase
MTGERTLNDPDIVAGWVERIRTQIAPLLDFDGPFAARMVNNLDWTQSMGAIALLRDVGKHFRMSTMLARETVAARMTSDQGLSYTEFSYQVLQSMDYLELHRRYGCVLQTGGNDQWGNLVAGVELIRRADGAVVHALTTPLITKSDGTKFGKTESGTVWLDPTMTTPYAFYQFWLNTDDRDVLDYLGVFTFRTREELAALATETADHPERRTAQRALAAEATTLVHGEAACHGAIAAAEALFGRGDLRALDAPTLEAAVEGLPSVAIGGDGAGAGAGAGDGDGLALVIDLFVGAGLERGRGAARRTLAEGGLYVNNTKVTDPDARLDESDLLHGTWALLRRGRKTLAVGVRR